jgi:uncharacterized protein (TIGR00375 family)
MKQIADFHIHSRYSRACSPALTLENIENACRIKGIDIIGTGDFTFPLWFESIKNELEEIKGRGVYKFKKSDDDRVKFVLTTEVALIYKKNDSDSKGGASRCRRVHMVAHAPNLKAVQDLNEYLDGKYNIRSDGRPILGMSIEEFMDVCFKINPKFLIYPAHIWTPWFAIFGSKSGFDSLEECFGKFKKDIFAYETGLSSDPEMNWRLSSLDNLTLLSNSDAHSLANLAREANVFELKEVSYDEIYEVIKNKNTKYKKSKNGSYLDYTIEFFPEEGMYHYDGHRDCKIRFSPAETVKNREICPICKKKVVVGVDYRVNELADRKPGFRPKNVPGFKKLVGLDKIISETLGIKSRNSKKVKEEYNKFINSLGNELDILVNAKIEDIEKISHPKIAEGIKRVRDGELIIEPGYDGKYGEVNIFSKQERKENKQQKLF